jgi:hypothetical protein
MKVRKIALGAKPRSSVHHIQRSNFTTAVLRWADMDRGSGEGMQENSLQQNTAPYKYKNSKSFSNNI